MKIARARTAAVFLLLLAFPADAHAYIDPTAGGLLLQTMIAAAFGLTFWFREGLAGLWRRLTGAPRRPKE